MEKKKIKVELEVTPEELRKMVEVASKGARTLSDRELEELSSKGVIRAGDFLKGAPLSYGGVGSEVVSSMAGEVVVRGAEKGADEAMTKTGDYIESNRASNEREVSLNPTETSLRSSSGINAKHDKPKQ